MIRYILEIETDPRIPDDVLQDIEAEAHTKTHHDIRLLIGGIQAIFDRRTEQFIKGTQ